MCYTLSVNYDIPKTIIKPLVVVERSFNGPSQQNNNNKSLPEMPLGFPDLGGYPFVTVSGTGATGVASGVSLSAVPSYTINFTPRDGPIPSHEIQIQHVARNMEKAEQISWKK